MPWGNAKGISQVPSQTENSHQTEINVAVNLGQHASRTSWQLQGCTLVRHV